ncbi:LacI family DNA-binding transcriptional regulator [Bacteroidota bacterium]
MSGLRTVAKYAKVSVSTVSRVINEPEKVNPATRIKVLKAIKKLNYKPNLTAQRLRSKAKQRNLIGLLVPDIQNPFYVEVVRGVEDQAYKNGYAVLMGNFAQDEIKEKMYLDIMHSEEIDGLIVAPAHERDEKVIELLNHGIPIICVDRGLKDVDVDVVLVDNEKGAYDAVTYLIKKGHRRIAYIGGMKNIPTTLQRKEGYQKALRENGLKLEKSLIRFGNSKHESGKQIAEELLNCEKPPTAFFTGNNLITLGALETIHNKKLNIPDDLAIIGFDDMPWAISLNPPLTAVGQPGYEIGKRAADVLLQRINDPDRLRAKIVLNTELKIRESC